MAGALLMRGNPLIGALIGVLLWILALERRFPANRPANAGTSDDPYAVLGVSPQASDAEIELAWRRAVAAAHPDRQVDAAARAAGERRMHQLNAARRRIQALRRNR